MRITRRQLPRHRPVTEQRPQIPSSKDVIITASEEEIDKRKVTRPKEL